MAGTLLHPTTVRYLGIYVNDHRAAAAAGLALARRAQRENQGTPFGDVLSALITEIEEDMATLGDVADALGVRSDPVKVGAARAGEMLSRLKLNGQIRGYSPLSRLLELEGLMSGIDAKRHLWLSLQHARRPRLAEFDFERLAQRAATQLDRLEPHHLRAAELALSGDPPDEAARESSGEGERDQESTGMTGEDAG